MPRLTPILLALLPILPPAFSSPFPTPFNTQPGQPIPPSQALASILTPPGLTASLFASEPQVQQPIAIATDPKGRLWVAENYTYGEAKVGFDLSLRDRIVILEDSDHDGLADRRTVFTDQLQRLSSVEVGFDGVWVLAPPQLLFFPDKNHDDQPDSPPVVLLDGFDSGPVRHNLANGLRWGPDGWLYGRHGIQATSLVGPPNTPPDLRTPINCGIWRYHPTRKIFEVVASGTTNPWGLDWDHFGEAFFTNTVIGHLWHLIPGAHYDRMYGKDLTPHTYELLPQHANHLHWDNTGQWQKAGREKNGADSFGGGHAHEGCLIYQGNSWPAEFHNQLFTINFYGRRLNREELLPKGSGYLAAHLPDLLQIGDPWFRGTDLLPASDGSVFLADWSDTGECHENDGVHRTSGRIYQISATKKSPPPPDLTPLSNLQLVALQQSPNQWLVRQSRLLLASRATTAPLEDARLALLKLFHSPNPHNPQLHDTNPHNPQLTLHALWTLHAINAASTPLLLETLNHPHPHLRIWAIRLLTDDPSSLLSPPDAFLRLAATDPSPAVRLALASALQRFPATARPPLARPLLAHAEDALDHNLPLLLWYGLIPLGDSHPDLLADLLAHSKIPTTSRLIARRLAESLPTLPQTIEPLLATALAASPTVQAAILSGLATGLKKTTFLLPPPLWPKLSASLTLISNPSVQSDLATLNRLFLHSQNLAQLAARSLDPTIPTPDRLQTLTTLAPTNYPHFHDLCSQLLHDPALRLHAAPLLAKLHDPRDSTPLLQLASLLPPTDQLQLFTTLAAELPHASALLEKIIDHSLPISTLTPALEKSLRSHGNEFIDKLFDSFYSTNPPPLSPAQK